MSFMFICTSAKKIVYFLRRRTRLEILFWKSKPSSGKPCLSFILAVVRGLRGCVLCSIRFPFLKSSLVDIINNCNSVNVPGSRCFKVLKLFQQLWCNLLGHKCWINPSVFSGQCKRPYINKYPLLQLNKGLKYYPNYYCPKASLGMDTGGDD